jgi:hypothetical protein
MEIAMVMAALDAATVRRTDAGSQPNADEADEANEAYLALRNRLQELAPDRDALQVALEQHESSGAHLAAQLRAAGAADDTVLAAAAWRLLAPTQRREVEFLIDAAYDEIGDGAGDNIGLSQRSEDLDETDDIEMHKQ